jgi:predicted DNA-binding protein with PD1-like motif
MRFTSIHEPGELNTFVLVFDKDDDVQRALLDFAGHQKLAGASLSAIGAFDGVTLGYFDRGTRDYLRIPIREQVEVLSFMGNIARAGTELKLHAHVVVGKRDGTAWGGHFLDGRVWPTLEMIVAETRAPLRRVYDAETGLALISVGG